MVLAEGLVRHDPTLKDAHLILPESGFTIPVYNFRDIHDQALIAGHITDGAQMAMFGGVWGGFKGVRIGTQGEKFFHRVKPGRPKEAKIAMMIPPEDSRELMDWSRVHPDFRYLADGDNFKELWDRHGAYLHVIGPVMQSVVPDVFETTPEDYSARYNHSDPIPYSTACFFWRDDPHLDHLSTLVRSASDGEVLIGVTSLNKHGEQPPYTYEEFVDHMVTGKADPRDIHLVVRDPIYEGSEALGSHTQVRLPFEHEEPVLKVLRIGTLSPEGFGQLVGKPVEIIPDAKDVRKSKGVNVDLHIAAMNQHIRAQWETQRAPLVKSI